ncbi:MAG TPA: VWA domain-containing protein [Anaerolineae bacterium]|nr:VWA domain-containing protein [Anaerolineae bacterium]HQK12675.1 VWA domain-containing protein [Anaerolineae bacterium]
MELTSDQQRALLRWRLALGQRAERALGGRMALGGLASVAPEQDVFGLDDALELVYGGEKGPGGAAASLPNIPRWLGDVRRYFPNDVVAMIQKDAIERRGLRQLLLEKETLPKLEKNVELAATLIALQKMIPDEVKETARQVVREIVEQIRDKLEPQIRQAVIGALARNRRSVLPVYRNVDWKRTIERNLKHYDPARRVLIPERFYFWANQRRLREWQIILCVDQSGSMANSVVYASIMAAIFASLDALRTHLIFFDTDIADMTDLLDDPVELLFGAQLGGGTDIARAVAYAADLVLQPEKTLFILITDLYEGGDEKALLGTLSALVESHVRVLCLLALDDTGRPSFNHGLAQQVRALDIPAFGCTPGKLAELIEDMLREK